jgi:hypothetical protein
MAGGADTVGAADTAGTAADGTVIIDSELGHGARRPSPQRARGILSTSGPLRKGAWSAFVVSLFAWLGLSKSSVLTSLWPNCEVATNPTE